jgi:hypothetical protein
MGDLTKGSSFTNGQQLLATDLNDLVDNAVINSGAVTAGHLSTHATENIINGQGILALADISNADYILVWSATHGAFRRVLKSDFLSSVAASLEVGGTPLVDPATNIIQVPIVIQGSGISSAGDLSLAQGKSLMFNIGTGGAGPYFVNPTGEDNIVKFLNGSDTASAISFYTSVNIIGTTNSPDGGIALVGADPSTGARSWLITSEATPNSGGGTDLNMFTYGANANLANDRIQLFGNVSVTGDLTNSVSGDSYIKGQTGVIPGVYTNANITVDIDGRLTSAGNGTAGNVTGVATDVIWDTAGDLAVASGTDAASKLGTVNSGATAPEWAAASGGGGGITFIASVIDGIGTGCTFSNTNSTGGNSIGSIVGIRKKGAGFAQQDYTTSTFKYQVSDTAPAGYNIQNVPSSGLAEIRMRVNTSGLSPNAEFTITDPGVGYTYPVQLDINTLYFNSLNSDGYKWPPPITAIFTSPSGNVADDVWVDVAVTPTILRYVLPAPVNTATALVSVVGSNLYGGGIPKFRWISTTSFELILDNWMDRRDGANARAYRCTIHA